MLFPCGNFANRNYDFLPNVLIFETFRFAVFVGDFVAAATGAVWLLRGRPGPRLTGATDFAAGVDFRTGVFF